MTQQIKEYLPQSKDKIDLVNENKEIEERLLRRVDELRSSDFGRAEFDFRWLSIARTHFEQGFMALNRGIFSPKRIDLVEEGSKE